MQSSVKIPKAASVLVSSYGLLSWLDSVVTGLERDQPRRTNAALRVLSCLWTSLKEHPGAVAGLILKLLLALLPKLHLKLNAKILRVYLDALSGSAAAATIQLPWLLTLSDVNAVLRYCQGILGPVQDLEDLLLFGPEFAHQRIQKDATKELASVRYHLRCFILTRLKQASQSK
ncbi:hypothetical protein PR048_006576 [Dryococelus australis]|uniref:Uncharacterized protein n=1 Tax=Dryococelus australis TaxID=614101 RepID=A0ABQ9IBC7_9NEOP|nr:hypothetical protein PR048_006576 [Dryococelus australis]